MNEILKQNKTAFYVFDVKTLKDRVAYLRKMLPEDVAICYAIKANTFITAELENDVDRFEICSPGEAEICDLLDIPDKMMVISGVYKTPEVMENMIANGKCDRIFTVERSVGGTFRRSQLRLDNGNAILKLRDTGLGLGNYFLRFLNRFTQFLPCLIGELVLRYLSLTGTGCGSARPGRTFQFTQAIHFLMLQEIIDDA